MSAYLRVAHGGAIIVENHVDGQLQQHLIHHHVLQPSQPTLRPMACNKT